MTKVIVHIALSNQRLDHSHLGNNRINFREDKKATEEWRKNAIKKL